MVYGTVCRVDVVYGTVCRVDVTYGTGSGVE